jgi:alkaline phosphatase D
MRLSTALLLLLTACAAPSAASGRLASLHAGPMVGHVEPHRAIIWWQTAEPGPIEVRFWQADAPPQRELGYFSVDSRAVAAGCVELGVGSADAPLRPRTAYIVELRDRHGLHQAQFRTPPPPGESASLTVGFGSCASNWGADASQPVWGAVAAADPDLFLWLGDNIYFDREAREWERPEAMAKRWRTQRGLPSLQPALAGIDHYAIWDDHDYGPDNADGTYQHKDVALELFDRYWATPELRPESGVYQHFRRGRVSFFLLDGRSFRAPESTPAGQPKPLLGEAQWLRLEADLAACDDGSSDWLVIVSGNQILSDYHRFETWGRFPAERARLLDLLSDTRAQVVLLSGDRHIGEVLVETDPATGRRYVELTSSPLAAGIGEHTADEAAAERLPGSEIREDHFALLRFEPGGGELRLSYQPVAADGRPLRPWLDVGGLLEGFATEPAKED